MIIYLFIFVLTMTAKKLAVAFSSLNQWQRRCLASWWGSSQPESIIHGMKGYIVPLMLLLVPSASLLAITGVIHSNTATKSIKQRLSADVLSTLNPLSILLFQYPHETCIAIASWCTCYTNPISPCFFINFNSSKNPFAVAVAVVFVVVTKNETVAL